MKTHNSMSRIITLLLTVCSGLVLAGLLVGLSARPALSSAGAPENSNPMDTLVEFDSALTAPDAPCAGGPVIDGVTLDECFDETFSVGGTTKTVRVWYTNNVSTVQRTVDGTTYNLTHWVNNDTQPQQVAQWAREAWQRYWEIFGRHPYDNGCGNRINVQLEDGVGWAGIAYWADPGSCRIGIDLPTVRAGNAQAVVYHEFQHYLQYSFNDGCYAYLRANYDNGSAAGVAEFVEGYADLAMDSINAAVDGQLFNDYVKSYNPQDSFYDKAYWDVYNKYFIEQLGSSWTPADPQHHMDAVRSHYAACDAADTLYVLDTLIPTLKPGISEERLFLDFFAANWAKNWADPIAQPELVYLDDDSGPNYGAIALYADENISTGTKNWSGEATPEDWAGRYYQVKPQAGCSYVTVAVDGIGGANLGINLMAADTAGSTSVERAAWMGEDFSRTFPGHGVYDRIVASVNAFEHTYAYDVSISCVNPVLDILEPKQTNFALVGAPDSPIAFLARIKITSGGNPVVGLVENGISAAAGGDAITIVPGSFSQVGEEYWAIMLPPEKPMGTTFVDFEVCLDGSICDTETNALLYVAPGNTDFAMVFDGSGSMSWEVGIGEGTRLENAQKAGTVLADLLQVGDRIAVTSFSAWNNPLGCGLPYGTGDCALDIRTHLGRTDVTGSSTIDAAKSAVGAITARDWTPIGAGLVDAKNKLVAGPTNENPKHIILLSDGDENVNPLYEDVRSELIASGVVVDTIRFSNDAPGELLAQIAADTGGSYTYVPTTGGTAVQAVEDSAKIQQQLSEMGVSDAVIQQITADMLPGPLGLDNVYDLYETKGQNAARLYHNNFLNVPADPGAYEVREISQYVDGSANEVRFVVAGKQEDAELEGSYCGYIRRVHIQRPGDQTYYAVSPVSPRIPPPSNWDIRNSLYDDVVIVNDPEEGFWNIAVYYWYYLCAQTPVEKLVATAVTADFMVNISAQTDINLTARFLPPINNNQGMAGDPVPVVATLMGKNGALPGAEFWGLKGVIVAVVESPVGIVAGFLFDDGQHGDGKANDGIYGNTYYNTAFGGTYNARLLAWWKDPTSGEYLTREWNGSIWINGPQADDLDKDGMPDPWERRCKLNTQENDASADNDHDGLNNYLEYTLGTLPCQPDTDKGGELDSSEYYGGRNPLVPEDDLVPHLRHFSVAGLNNRIKLNWTPVVTHTNVYAFISEIPGELGQPVGLGNTGNFTVTLPNDMPITVTLVPVVDSAIGDFGEPVTVVPRADPDPPSGYFMINNDAEMTYDKGVILNISATDTPLDGLATSSNPNSGSLIAAAYNEISADIKIRVSNDPSFSNAEWQPLVGELPWELNPGSTGVYSVYMQFRDGAGNNSLVIWDQIIYQGGIYLPLIVH